MNSYGPPHVFKQVDRKTGELIQVFSLSDDNGFMLNCGAAVLQSTGYKDKTGADVFFGDKLVDKKGEIWTVVYKSYTAQILLESLEPESKAESYRGMAWAQHMQIIGNTHTPHVELMKAAEGGEKTNTGQGAGGSGGHGGPVIVNGHLLAGGGSAGGLDIGFGGCGPDGGGE
jgi:hypothetical protein